jgi:hypothetical protein
MPRITVSALIFRHVHMFSVRPCVVRCNPRPCVWFFRIYSPLIPARSQCESILISPDKSKYFNTWRDTGRLCYFLKRRRSGPVWTFHILVLRWNDTNGLRFLSSVINCFLPSKLVALYRCLTNTVNFQGGRYIGTLDKIILLSWCDDNITLLFSANKALVNALIAALQALANCNNSSGNSRALTDIANLLNATVSPASNPDQSLQQNQQQQPQLSSAQWVVQIFLLHGSMMTITCFSGMIGMPCAGTQKFP